MISLELWRAKIGLFNCSRRPPSSSLFTNNLHHHHQSVAHGSFLSGQGHGAAAGLFSSLCRSLLIRRALALLLVAVITHLLLSAGDVEQNPGPISKDAVPTLLDLQLLSFTRDGSTVRFRLMDRIKPRVTQLAIALIFPQHIIAQLETELDPVSYLLIKWLSGGNQEQDKRPVTWATLITALKHAGLVDEVGLLEEHFITPAPQEAGRGASTDSKKEKPTSDIILQKLRKHKFPDHKWMDLAIGLGMGGRIEGYAELPNSAAKLSAMVTDWTAGVVEEGIKWDSLVTAVDMSGQKIVAINLANDVGVPPPEDDDTEVDTASAKILKEGAKCEIKMTITKLLISGAAATGKTSLIDMLLGNPVTERDSTLLSRPLRYAKLTVGGDSNQIWECLENPEQLSKVLASWIKKVAAMNEPKQDLVDVPKPASVQQNTSDHEPITEVPYNKTETHKGLITLIKTVEMLNVETVHWIYTIDSGGQPAFQDVLPAFIRGNSVAIHTLKLNECLNDPVKVAFSFNGQHLISPSKEVCMTNLQLIETLIRSSSFHFSVHSSKTHTKPRCIIVGTHLDKVHECSKETIGEKDRQLSKIHRIEEVLIKPPNSGAEDVLFTVNTRVTGDQRENFASTLRKKITEPYERSKEESIKIEWFVFELHLRSHVATMDQQGIISMPECKSIGRENFDMTDVQVQDCIQHLHDQTLLLYFKDIDKDIDIVFLNPQSILDKVSAILFVSFLNEIDTLSSEVKDKIDDIVHKLPPSSPANLRNQGFFDVTLLKCLYHCLQNH